jgi:hypothetical protein
MNVLGVAIALAIWVPLVGIARIWTATLVKERRVSPRAGALAMAIVFGVLPWLLQLTAAVRPDPAFAGILSVVIFVIIYRGYSSVLARKLSESEDG